jgi:YYY domain-containing protein
MSEAFRWYLATVAIGGAGLLPAAALFPTLRSSGVLYARVLALSLLSVGAWWLGWSGVVPYGLGAIAIVLAVMWGATIVLVWRRPELVRAVWDRRWLLLVGEGVFLLVFAMVGWARAQAPDAANTEKPMDLMLLTAVHRAETLPPPDAWLGGERLSYYHLGHLTTDAVGQLSGNGPEIAFNLGIAMVGALAATAAFGLAGDLVGLSAVRRGATPWVAGGAAVLALLWVSPLAGEVDSVALLIEHDGNLGEALREFWWWWDATRVLPQPITEFPAFSLLLGDLHAHVLALPIALVAVALALVTFEGRTPLTWRGWLSHPWRLFAAGVIFASLFMTNSWDVITYGPLWFGAALVAFRRVGWAWPLAVFGAMRYLALPVGAALVVAAPFLANLESPSTSLALVTTEAADPGNWLLIWLVPLLPLVLAVVVLRAFGDRRTAVIAGGVTAAAIVAWAVLQVGGGFASALVDRGSGWVVLALMTFLIAVGVSALVRAERRREAALAGWLALAVGALVLLFATELINIETGQPGRFNSVFKLWYHFWTLIAVAGAAAIGTAWDRVDWSSLVGGRLRAVRALALAGVAVVYIGAFLYAPLMAFSRQHEGASSGLDALAYLERTDPGLAGAVAFANAELDPAEDVVLQSVSDAYGPSGYLSAASGVPTLLNWPWHQVQWRGPDAPLAGRREATERIYALGATDEAAEVAAEWGVTYVYVGRIELGEFGAEVASRFTGWPVAWEGGGAVIFAVPPQSNVMATP